MTEGDKMDTLNFAKELGLNKNSKKRSKADTEMDLSEDSDDSVDMGSILDDEEIDLGDLNNDLAAGADDDLCDEDFIEFEGMYLSVVLLVSGETYLC